MQARIVPITLIAKSCRQLGRVLLVDPREAAPDAGVVDEPGERPERLRRLLEQTGEGDGVGDIGLERLARPPEFLIAATVASAALASAA